MPSYSRNWLLLLCFAAAGAAAEYPERAIRFHSVRELIDYAKKNPGKLFNASSSNGSPGHVSGELFKYMTGLMESGVPGYEVTAWS